MNDCNLSVVGEFQDTIKYPDGRIEVKKPRYNTIVVGVGLLIAGLMKCQKDFVGLQFWAVGSGSDDWDNVDPTPASPNDTCLVNEIGRKRIFPSDIVFIDDDGNISEEPTDKIKINIEFGPYECNGVWREFSLVGGNATVEVNTGIPINHKTHETITKKEGTIITREIKFTFRKGGVVNG